MSLQSVFNCALSISLFISFTACTRERSIQVKENVTISNKARTSEKSPKQDDDHQEIDPRWFERHFEYIKIDGNTAYLKTLKVPFINHTRFWLDSDITNSSKPGYEFILHPGDKFITPEHHASINYTIKSIHRDSITLERVIEMPLFSFGVNEVKRSSSEFTVHQVNQWKPREKNEPPERNQPNTIPTLIFEIPPIDQLPEQTPQKKQEKENNTTEE